MEADQNLLNAHNMDIRTLNWAIRSNNTNVSAGHVYDADRRLAVRSVGEFERVSELRQLPLRNGFILGDVADVSYDFPERKSFRRLDGRSAVSIEIRKASTANLVATADAIKKEMASILDDVGRDKLNAKIIRDRSGDVLKGIGTLCQSALIGGLLAVSVIFIFLRNFRSTVIIGSAIPISALCVFMMMYVLRHVFGSSITLNLISMMGLMVAVGMLVDPAVVTLENIFRKRYELGVDVSTAAREGAREVGLPVLTAALTTVCVFIPIIFVTETGYSLWMKDFAVTVCISVIASMVVALALVPLAASRAYRRNGDSRLDRWLQLGLIALAGAVATRLVAAGWSRRNGSVDGGELRVARRRTAHRACCSVGHPRRGHRRRCSWSSSDGRVLAASMPPSSTPRFTIAGALSPWPAWSWASATISTRRSVSVRSAGSPLDRSLSTSRFPGATPWSTVSPSTSRSRRRCFR